MNSIDILKKANAGLDRLIDDNTEMRALIYAIADYLDVWAFDDEALVNPEPGSLENLAARIIAVVRRGGRP